MSERVADVKLHDGTRIRHKMTGYEGRIEGTTEIKSCFTAKGQLLEKPDTKQKFQYRVVIAGEAMRQIAPAEDLEILESVEQMVCPRCHASFQNKPGVVDKPAGRCQCGGWICPSCLTCQDTNEIPAGSKSSCLKQRKRLARKSVLQKRAKGN